MNKYIIQAPNLKNYPHGFTTIFSPQGEENYTLKGNEKNRRELENQFAGYRLSFVHQTHSSTSVWIEREPFMGEADAQITSQEKLLLCSSVADCAPVLIAFPSIQVIASIHAGWRGALDGIVDLTIQKISDKYRMVSDGIVAIGPHLQHWNCEFQGKELELWKIKFPESVLSKNGKNYINISKKIIDDCERHGISDIWVSPECTFDHPDKYFSYRRQREKSGRQVGFIGLP